MDLIAQRIVCHKMTTSPVTSRVTRTLATLFAVLVGMVIDVRFTVFLTMMTRTVITRASRAQGGKHVCRAGMTPAVKCTVLPGMTQWQAIFVIPRERSFVYNTGMVKTNVMFIVSKTTIPVLVTTAIQWAEESVCKVGMVHNVTVVQGMTLTWDTFVIPQLAKRNV